MRPIRSYVLRQGRTTPAQKRALDELFPKYGVAFCAEKLASPRPLVLEIGSGMGETTIAIAKAHPEAEFVAVEVHGPGVGSLHAATDWPDYAEQMSAVLSAEPLLELSHAGFAARPVTKFESRGRRLGHEIRELFFRRRI